MAPDREWAGGLSPSALSALSSFQEPSIGIISSIAICYYSDWLTHSAYIEVAPKVSISEVANFSRRRLNEVYKLTWIIGEI